MNTPNSVTRFLGALPVTIAVYIGSATAIFQWVHGQAPGWSAFIALCLLGAARKASREMRRYKQWSAEWQAMGGAQTAVARRRRFVPPWANTKCAAAALVILPVVLIATHGVDDASRNLVFLIWVMAALYLLWKAAARIWRWSVSKSRGDAAAYVVAWALPRASSSPSREQASRNLPGYCAGLLQR